MQEKNPLTKKEHGQLLQAVEWFKGEYQGWKGLRVVVHPNAAASKSVTVGTTNALTLPKLGELIGAVRTLLNELTDMPMSRCTLIARCENRLKELHLDPDELVHA